VINVVDAKGWRVGDQIFVASSSFQPEDAERRSISAISGNAITLDSALKNEHLCVSNTVGTYTLQQCTEVGLLTRNIVVQGDSSSSANTTGGHTMIGVGGKAYVDGVEFNTCGQSGRLGRYCFHWHLVGDADGQFIRNASAHSAFHKGIVVHGTNGAEVSGNVIYDTLGHSVMLAEDGVETRNQLLRNLAALARVVPEGKRVIDSDGEPANYWMQNPNNTIRDNVAAGAEKGHGFWYDLPKWPTGNFKDCTTCASPSGLVAYGDGTTYPADKSLWGTPFGEFSGNVAHSSSQLWKASGIGDGGSGIRIGTYLAQTKQGAAILRDSAAYWNGAIGFWMDSDPGHAQRVDYRQIRLVNSKAADNKHAVHSIGAIVEDSLLAGLVSKKDMFWTYGETYGGTAMASFTYDDVTHFKGVTFANWKPYTGPEDGIQRSAGAFGMQDERFQVEIPLVGSGLKFVNASIGGGMRSCAYSGEYQQKCDKARAWSLEVPDGSLTGTGQAESLVYNNPLLVTADCKPSDNPLLYTCAGGSRRYIALSVNGVADQTELIRADGNRNTLNAIEAQAAVHTLLKAEEIYTINTTNWSRVDVKVGYNEPYGTWVIVAMPYSSAASVKNGGQQVGSLDALRTATSEAWFNDTANKRMYHKNFGDITTVCASATCN
jgi:hypothetical protein